MEFKIELQSEDEAFALTQTKSLRQWLQNEEALADAKITQDRSPIKPGMAGVDLLTVLQVVLSSALLGELSKVLQVWFQERSKRIAAKTPELKLSITRSDGTKFDVDTKNLGDLEKTLIENLSPKPG